MNEVMGLGLFRERRVLMDFKNDRLKILADLPSDIKKWSSYPIEPTASGLRVTASAGGMPLHLIVDTAASHSLLFSDRLPPGLLFSGAATLSRKRRIWIAGDKNRFTDREGKARDDQAVVASGATPPELDFDGLWG